MHLVEGSSLIFVIGNISLLRLMDKCHMNGVGREGKQQSSNSRYFANIQKEPTLITMSKARKCEP